jgi:hypothetical protein
MVNATCENPGSAARDAEFSPDGKPLVVWLTAKEAAEQLDISRKLLAKLGDTRQLTRRVIPGGNPKYLRSDVERLARESTTESIGIDAPVADGGSN